jgi:hypothetical protein
MVDRSLWSKTQSWVRQEMIDLQHDPETRALPGAGLLQQNAKVRKAIGKWLSFRITSKPLSRTAIEKASGPYNPNELKDEFEKSMRKVLKESEYSKVTHKQWVSIWNLMETRFIRIIRTVLLPFDLQRAAPKAVEATFLAEADNRQTCDSDEEEDAVSEVLQEMEQQPDVGEDEEEDDEEDEEDDDSSVSAKKAAKDYAACRGVEWLYAVQKRMEVLHTRDVLRWKAEQVTLSRCSHVEASPVASSNMCSGRSRRVLRRKRTRMGRAEPQPKLFHLFPAAGNVAGNIMVTEQLLMCMMRDMQCKQKTEVDKQKSSL